MASQRVFFGHRPAPTVKLLVPLVRCPRQLGREQRLFTTPQQAPGNHPHAQRSSRTHVVIVPRCADALAGGVADESFWRPGLGQPLGAVPLAACSLCHRPLEYLVHLLAVGKLSASEVWDARSVMTEQMIQAVEQDQLKKDHLPQMSVGDTVDVHVRILEGSKERIQLFSGVVMKKQGSGLVHSITVRRIVANEGVERTFKIHSPAIAKVEVKRQGHVRRSKLYYLRERVGKKRRLRDRRRGLGNVNLIEEKTSEPSPQRETVSHDD